MRKHLSLEWIGIFFLSLLVFLFGLNKINLITADIGRHLINGKLFIDQQTLVSSNHYSYTMQDELVTNHHWLSGVIFYWVWQLAGFNGLSIFYALLLAISFVFFILIGRRHSSWWPLALSSVIIIPLIGLRAEVRPEIFSVLFLGLETWLLLTITAERQLRSRWWFVFGLIQILWVNLHLFFFLSWGLVGAMLLQQLIQRNNQASKFMGILLLVVIVTSFISPFTYRGVIEPFFILQDFGYRLAENQSLVFMIQRFGTLRYWHGLSIASLGLVGGGYWLWKYRAKRFFEGILLISFAFFGLVMNRFISMLGLVAIGFIPWILTELVKKKEVLEKSLFSFLSVFLLLIFISVKNYLSPVEANFGTGLREGMEDSALFFKQHDLRGPIFNNYDIGGYLIFEFFPTQRVFVDNRPEAYSPQFFDQYIAAQEDEIAWNELDAQHNFQTIFFYRHDFTPWAQPFLIERLEDESWVPVYVDDYVLILVKENQSNQEIIDQFELPLEIFSIS